MMSMVRDRRRAFYRLGRIMELNSIPREAYRAFIAGWMERSGFEMEKPAIEKILELGQDVPYSVQRLSHTYWELVRERKGAAEGLIEKLPEIIVRQDSPHYELIWQTASQAQRNLLIILTGEKELTPSPKNSCSNTESDRHLQSVRLSNLS